MRVYGTNGRHGGYSYTGHTTFPDREQYIAYRKRDAAAKRKKKASKGKGGSGKDR